MRFKSASIKDFKRFTDLTVQGVPEMARLIMLTGPNGSGKSSFFDALISWHKQRTRGESWNDDYHTKVYGGTNPDQGTAKLTVTFHNDLPSDAQGQKKNIYVRSAYRNDPEFQLNRIQREANPLDEGRIARMIDNDVAVSKNYQRLAAQVFTVFDVEPMMTNKFTDAIIRGVRDPVSKLFPNLTLNSLANPLEDGTFRFTKGSSHGFPFKNLSGGEKSAFDLILDLVIAKRVYDDTLFCIDEPESHMNARLQAELLSVLYDLIPENCQLMLATHSIGMMRRARDIEADHPASVVFLDFDEHDFDQPCVIEPAVTNRVFWNRAYDVALNDLAALVAPERVVICEGEPKNRNTGQNYSHDARCYEQIFQSEFPETQFVPGGNASEVANDQRGISYAIGMLVKGSSVTRLIDRDDLSPQEVTEKIGGPVKVLSRRNLESYLFDDEVISRLAASLEKEDKVEELLAKKKDIQESRPGDPPDDLKLASGEIYVACRNILALTQRGNDPKTFMRDTLAPLIQPGMKVYEELKSDIFGSDGGVAS